MGGAIISVTLRQPNNLIPIPTLLNVVGILLNQNKLGNYNTYLAQISPSQTGAELVFTDEKYRLSQSLTAIAPYAVLVSLGKQTYHIEGGPRWRSGQCTVDVTYFGRWDTQPATIDDIWSTMSADVARMQANIESNDSLTYQAQDYCLSIPLINVTAYKDELDTQFQGLTLVYQTLSLTINQMPYDAVN